MMTNTDCVFLNNDNSSCTDKPLHIVNVGGSVNGVRRMGIRGALCCDKHLKESVNAEPKVLRVGSWKGGSK